MKQLIFIILLSFNPLSGYSQQYFVGFNTSYLLDELPSQWYGGINTGVSFNKFSVGVQYLELLEDRNENIQLLGITLRGTFRPKDKLLNGFFQAGFASQIASSKTGHPIDNLYFNGYFGSDEDLIFNKESLHLDFTLGLSFRYRNFSIYTSTGYESRLWTGYEATNKNRSYNADGTGLIIRAGIEYFFEFGSKKE